eukprot:TRINITY_DN39_c0_g1_i16.p1 TRINITY_DN39_c0_g1~~TRINITY_DN39_c0_g1_i16.p1  ORF type:complete len:686 (+),score=132.19 TRINITY_DN39_c0_g1_i16:586-2643(+)
MEQFYLSQTMNPHPTDYLEIDSTYTGVESKLLSDDIWSSNAFKRYKIFKECKRGCGETMCMCKLKNLYNNQKVWGMFPKYVRKIQEFWDINQHHDALTLLEEVSFRITSCFVTSKSDPLLKKDHFLKYDIKYMIEKIERMWVQYLLDWPQTSSNLRRVWGQRLSELEWKFESAIEVAKCGWESEDLQLILNGHSPEVVFKESTIVTANRLEYLRSHNRQDEASRLALYLSHNLRQLEVEDLRLGVILMEYLPDSNKYSHTFLLLRRVLKNSQSLFYPKKLEWVHLVLYFVERFMERRLYFRGASYNQPEDNTLKSPESLLNITSKKLAQMLAQIEQEQEQQEQQEEDDLNERFMSIKDDRVQIEVICHSILKLFYNWGHLRNAGFEKWVSQMFACYGYHREAYFFLSTAGTQDDTLESSDIISSVLREDLPVRNLLRPKCKHEMSSNIGCFGVLDIDEDKFEEMTKTPSLTMLGNLALKIGNINEFVEKILSTMSDRRILFRLAEIMLANGHGSSAFTLALKSYEQKGSLVFDSDDEVDDVNYVGDETISRWLFEYVKKEQEIRKHEKLKTKLFKTLFKEITKTSKGFDLARDIATAGYLVEAGQIVVLTLTHPLMSKKKVKTKAENPTLLADAFVKLFFNGSDSVNLNMDLNLLAKKMERKRQASYSLWLSSGETSRKRCCLRE